MAHDPERRIERLKRLSKQHFKCLRYGAFLTLQAVPWYLRYPLSHRGVEAASQYRSRHSCWVRLRLASQLWGIE